jgi:hypothetical protein
MTIELSYERFNNGDDIVPRYSAEEVIRNTGVAKTLEGDDKITGVGPGMRSSISDSGIYNSGTIEMDRGDDMITGTYNATEHSFHNANYVPRPNNGRSPYRDNRGNFYYYAPDPNGPIPLAVNSYGIYNSGTIDTGDGDDTITGSNITGGYPIGGKIGLLDSLIGSVKNLIDPVNGLIGSVDRTYGAVGINNGGMINTGRGADSLISNGKLANREMFLGEGNDSIIATAGFLNRSIENYVMIDTGDGNDTITSYGVIYNNGKIDTGNGDDSIIAYGGFESGLNNSGSVVLGKGEDSLYGFGSGDFNGGDDEDTLELTFGSYTVVGIVGAEVSFTNGGGSVMKTSNFEILKAGDDIHYFNSLAVNQEINVW